jgi:S1-C subfamily serine protease
VVTFGFPFAGMLSAGATLTTGEVSALSGLRDNQRHYQISAPVQVGNSGGPLFDLGGRVIGVVVSKLNAQRIAQVTGDLPQNVNFAVKGQEAVEFLQRSGVRPAVAAAGRPALTAADVGELAEPSTVLLRCLR